MQAIIQRQSLRLRLDVLSMATWSSVALLFLSQSPFVYQAWVPNIWSISMVSLASCLALSEVRRGRTENHVHVLRAASTIDPLTGVGNRRWLDIEMKQRFAQLRRQNAPFSVVIMDIDHFKKVNDNWGHDAGDLILVSVATEIRKTLRDMDVMCRLGGEEFVAILPDTNEIAAIAAAERIRLAIAGASYRYRDKVIPITVSLGVTAAVPLDEAEDTLKRADDALYAAKRGGRNVSFVKTSRDRDCYGVGESQPHPISLDVASSLS